MLGNLDRLCYHYRDKLGLGVHTLQLRTEERDQFNKIDGLVDGRIGASIQILARDGLDLDASQLVVPNENYEVIVGILAKMGIHKDLS